MHRGTVLHAGLQGRDLVRRGCGRAVAVAVTRTALAVAAAASPASAAAPAAASAVGLGVCGRQARIAAIGDSVAAFDGRCRHIVVRCHRRCGLAVATAGDSGFAANAVLTVSASPTAPVAAATALSFLAACSDVASARRGVDERLGAVRLGARFGRGSAVDRRVGTAAATVAAATTAFAALFRAWFCAALTATLTTAFATTLATALATALAARRACLAGFTRLAGVARLARVTGVDADRSAALGAGRFARTVAATAAARIGVDSLAATLVAALIAAALATAAIATAPAAAAAAFAAIALSAAAISATALATTRARFRGPGRRGRR